MSEEIQIRKAKKEDLSEIVRLLFEDEIVGDGEEYTNPLPESYVKGFEAIDEDKNNLLIVAQNSQKIVGTLQITFVPGILMKGGTRALIEAVMVDKNCRSQGIGKKMMKWAIAQAKEKKCSIVQLTSNKKRPKAHKFYGELGFTATHEGFKMHLQD